MYERAQITKPTHMHVSHKKERGGTILRSHHPLVSIIILNFNGRKILRKCLLNLNSLSYPKYEVIVVDNGSSDGSVEMVKNLFPNVKLIENKENLGFAEGNNVGAKVARGKYIAFLNNDAFPTPGWLQKLVGTAEKDPKIAIVGSKIYRYGSKKIESAGAIITYPLGVAPGRGAGERDKGKYSEVEEVAYVGGAALLIRKDVFEKLGGFDSLYFCYHEETDLCWRARLAGYKVIYDPDAIVYHIGSYTSKESYFKIYHINRNRIITNIKNLGTKNLFYWAFFEAIYAFLLVCGGLILKQLRLHAKAEVQGICWVLCHLPIIIARRYKIQKKRVVTDEAVLKLHPKLSLKQLLREALRDFIS